jgi:hypothetical protein
MNTTNNVPAARIINNVNVTALAAGVRGALDRYAVTQLQSDPFTFTATSFRLTVGAIAADVLKFVPNAEILARVNLRETRTRRAGCRVTFRVTFPNPARECTDVAYM